MRDKIIYVILIGILIYFSFSLNKDLKQNCYKKIPPASIIAFFALIFPRDYFKKDKVFVGWITYFFMVISFFVAIYLVGRLLGL